MCSSTRSEKITAIVSALIAVALLGAGVAAHQSRLSTGERIAQLESDLRLQLDVAYRHNVAEKRARVEQLNRTLDAWRAADRTAQNDDLLVAWLEGALLRSMPGSRAALPEAPDFAEASRSDWHAAKPTERLDSRREQPERRESSRSAAPTGSPPADGVALADRPAPTRADAARSYHVKDADESEVSLTGQTANASSRQPRRVSVNLARLAARIASYHDGLDAIEAELDKNGDALDAADLADCVLLAEQLSEQYEFTRLYYDALTGPDSRRIIGPRPFEATIARLRRELRAAEARNSDFLSTVDSRRSPQFVELDKRLARIEAAQRD